MEYGTNLSLFGALSQLKLLQKLPRNMQLQQGISHEVRNVEISRATQQPLNGKSHDFLAVFVLALKNQSNCIIFG